MGSVAENGPGRSRDYSLELPQIRTCALNASGSSRCGIAVPHTTRWFRGDTLVRHGVLGVVPTPPSTTRHPLRSTGSGRAVPPLQHYYGVLRPPDSLLAALRFLRLAIPWSACVSSPFGRKRTADGSSRSLLYRLLPIRSSSGNCQDLPSFRETLMIIRHVPPTPA